MNARIRANNIHKAYTGFSKFGENKPKIAKISAKIEKTFVTQKTSKNQDPTTSKTKKTAITKAKDFN